MPWHGYAPGGQQAQEAAQANGFSGQPGFSTTDHHLQERSEPWSAPPADQWGAAQRYTDPPPPLPPPDGAGNDAAPPPLPPADDEAPPPLPDEPPPPSQSMDGGSTAGEQEHQQQPPHAYLPHPSLQYAVPAEQVCMRTERTKPSTKLAPLKSSSSFPLPRNLRHCDMTHP